MAILLVERAKTVVVDLRLYRDRVERYVGHDRGLAMQSSMRQITQILRWTRLGFVRVYACHQGLVGS
jgi:hypothetical protein